MYVADVGNELLPIFEGDCVINTLYVSADRSTLFTSFRMGGLH